jgi:hypothetical protein
VLVVQGTHRDISEWAHTDIGWGHPAILSSSSPTENNCRRFHCSISYKYIKYIVHIHPSFPSSLVPHPEDLLYSPVPFSKGFLDVSQLWIYCTLVSLTTKGRTLNDGLLTVWNRVQV